MRATPNPAEGGERLRAAARDLVDAVMIDEGGTPGMAGNGGLLSRETIHKANMLRRLLDEGESDGTQQ